MGGWPVVAGEHCPDRFGEVDIVNIETPASAPGGEVVVYEASDGEVHVDVRLEQDTIWLPQRDMAAVFDTTPENVLMHLRNVFSSNELEAEATTKDFLVVRTEGRRRVRRRIRHYNLDAIISVGYRVNSRRGVRFRQWATRTLREHLVRRGEGPSLHRRQQAHRLAAVPAISEPGRRNPPAQSAGPDRAHPADR